MAYRKTELVLAHIEAQKQAILAAAIDCIRKGGMTAMTSTAISARAGISVGKVFHYFPDMAELAAQVEATIMTRDVEAIASAAKNHADHPTRALTAALFNLFVRLSDRTSRELLLHGESYRTRISRQLAHVIGPCLADRTEAGLLARGALGIIFEIAGMDGSADRRAQAAVLMACRGIGIPTAVVQRAIEAVVP